MNYKEDQHILTNVLKKNESYFNTFNFHHLKWKSVDPIISKAIRDTYMVMRKIKYMKIIQKKENRLNFNLLKSN